ncbi:hypothetical protein [Roseibium sp. RKSG952]|uniref:hypothetical protein n=1 Tax=Roseibium sp. RKSG952 TaxID=2529384 RepID=UPI001AD8F354|nr:hypothetical protein [Roseibium sp. RKSG952]
MPKGLEAAELKAEGRNAGARGHAAHNIVDLGAGYRMGGQANNDADYPTRLGEEQRVLVLARLEDGAVQPWADGDADLWALSEVSARRKRLDTLPLPDQSAPAVQAATRDWPEWKQKAYRLCVVGSDGAICDDLRYDEECGLNFG